MGKNPTCFISYSCDNEPHTEWVRKLAESLQKNSIETKLDLWDVLPGQDIEKYMRVSIQNSDYVILVCTSNYVIKANEKRGGAGYENMIINHELVKSEFSNSRFIPILREGDETPTYLSSILYVDFRKDYEYPKRLEELIKTIYRQPRFHKPLLGTKPYGVIGDNMLQRRDSKMILRKKFTTRQNPYSADFWRDESYPTIRLFEEDYVAIDKKKPELLAHLLLDNNDDHVLGDKSVLKLSGEYKLTAKILENEKQKVMLEFFAGNKSIANTILDINQNGATWSHKTKLCDLDNVEVFRVHVREILNFQRKKHVLIDGLWL
ncbi:MAG: TIR domain-containing protein [Methanosarcinaceae archaeon]|nr:TIR domain-containing protein [Methanosarcinaceae archaeon]